MITLAATVLALATPASLSACKQQSSALPAVVHASTDISTSDGVQLYYKDWGPKGGEVVVFSHGWPLSSDSWDSQMMFLTSKGYRVIALTAAAMDAPASRGTAMTWITTPMTWPR